MLFLTDVSHWWTHLSTYDLCIADKVYTYRNEYIIKDEYYRKVFVSNDLPNTYSAFAYFKKSDFSKKFWDLVSDIVKNWEDYYREILPNNKLSRLSIDLAFAIAVRILGIEDQIFSKFDFPKFTHMKSHVQGWYSLSDDWRNHVGAYFSKDGSLKIGNFQQTGIFHYTEKALITDEIMYLYENLLKEKNIGN
jgi:hypothetical protein